MKFLAKRQETSEPFWWVGEIVECWSCESRLELEKNNKPKKQENRFDNKDLIDFTSWTIKCPKCKKINNVRVVEH